VLGEASVVDEPAERTAAHRVLEEVRRIERGGLGGEALPDAEVPTFPRHPLARADPPACRTRDHALAGVRERADVQFQVARALERHVDRGAHEGRHPHEHRRKVSGTLLLCATARRGECPARR